MARKLRSRLTYANVMSSIAVFIALGTGAYAASGSLFVAGNGAINGCVPRRGGTLVVLRRGERCPKADESLTFNQQGPQGPMGFPGTNGQNGSNGVNGRNGANGRAGTNGANGAPGPPGPAPSTSVSLSGAEVAISTAGPAIVLSTQKLTTNLTSRIVANAALDIQMPVASGAVTCQLGIVSQQTFTAIGAPDTVSPDVSGPFETTLPLLGAIDDQSPGGYEIAAECSTTAPSAVLAGGDLTALAAADPGSTSAAGSALSPGSDLRR